MPYRPAAIANYFIRRSDPTADGLTPMKIQKLVYFAHGWHLALKDFPLIPDDIQAWRYGPVIVRLYHSLKEHSDSPVTEPIIGLTVVPEAGKPFQSLKMRRHEYSLNDDEPQRKLFTTALLEKIWTIYGRHDAIQLSKMTHEEGSPWDQVRKKFPEYLPQGIAIPNELIRDYFRQKLSQTKPTKR